MNANPNRSMRLNCEQLEDRCNPDGNVGVLLVGDSIYLFGDDFNNRVNVQQNVFGDVFVVGLDNTTVNGLPFLFLGRGIPFQINAFMGGGDDRTEIVNMMVTYEVNIFGQSGNDSSIVFNSWIPGSVRLLGEEGNDEGILTFVRVGGALIDGGPGIDAFHVDNTFTTWGLFLFNNEFQV